MRLSRLSDWLIETEKTKQMREWRESVLTAEDMMLRISELASRPLCGAEARDWFLMCVETLREMPTPTLTRLDAEHAAEAALQRLNELSDDRT